MRHVALNALFLDPGRSGGPETYLRGLVPAIAREAPGLRMTLLTTRRGAARLAEDGWQDIATLVALPADEGERWRRLFAEQLLAPQAARERGAELLHSLASFAPLAPRMPAVITLHDATFLRVRTFGAATTAAMAATSIVPAHRARVLITAAAAARDDLATAMRLAPEKFVIAPHGAGRLPDTPAAAEEEVRARLDIPPGARVVLCVAAVRPHKNQALLVHAMKHLPRDVVLVLAGALEPYADEVRAAGDPARVRLPGYVTDAELEALWEMAAAAAFPTLGEGFGLPVLEALQRGIPVACSGIPVLREIGGELPHFFDPHDSRAAAEAIKAALATPLDAPSASAWVARFTWEDAARATLGAYERALATSAGSSGS